MGAQVFRDFTKSYPVIVGGKGVFLYDRRAESIWMQWVASQSSVSGMASAR